MEVYTIGHSSHPFERFLELLRRHGVEVVADVRSIPASRRHPQYNRERLTAALNDHGIRYLFLGRELGARRAEAQVYEDDVVSYERIAQLPAFWSGLETIRQTAAERRIALMCAEKEPLDCHRTLLVCRHLRGARGDGIHHILADGRLEAHAEVERRLLAETGVAAGEPDLFAGVTQPPLERAYRARSHAIAYRRKPAGK